MRSPVMVHSVLNGCDLQEHYEAAVAKMGLEKRKVVHVSWRSFNFVGRVVGPRGRLDPPVARPFAAGYSVCGSMLNLTRKLRQRSQVSRGVLRARLGRWVPFFACTHMYENLAACPAVPVLP